MAKKVNLLLLENPQKLYFLIINLINHMKLIQLEYYMIWKGDLLVIQYLVIIIENFMKENLMKI